MTDCKICGHPLCLYAGAEKRSVVECAYYIRRPKPQTIVKVAREWIPVTERLPEKNTAVIAVTDIGIVFQCLYAYDGWDLWEGNEVNITHWMPLPEPPKEGE